MTAIPAAIDLEAMFPGLKDQPMRFTFHACAGLRDIPSQTQLIQYEGLETVEELVNYRDSKLDSMADCNSKRSPADTRVLIGLACTKKLKAIKFWVNTKLQDLSYENTHFKFVSRRKQAIENSCVEENKCIGANDGRITERRNSANTDVELKRTPGVTWAGRHTSEDRSGQGFKSL